MTLWGYRELTNGRSVYHFFRSEEKYCTVSCLKIGSIKNLTLTRKSGGSLDALSSTFDMDETVFRGMKRYISDGVSGKQVGVLELKDLRGMYSINDRYLVKNNGTATTFWDTENPGAPVAKITMDSMFLRKKNPLLAANFGCYILVSEDTVDETAALLFLLFPEMRPM